MSVSKQVGRQAWVGMCMHSTTATVKNSKGPFAKCRLVAVLGVATVTAKAPSSEMYSSIVLCMSKFVVRRQEVMTP